MHRHLPRLVSPRTLWSFLVSGVLALLCLSVAWQPIQAHALRSVPSKDWPMYLGSPGRTSYAAGETAINPVTAPTLTTQWTINANGPVTTEPIVVGGMVYWASWDGYEHASDTAGQPLWSTWVGDSSTPHCDFTRYGPSSSGVVTTIQRHGQNRRVLIVGGGDSQMYALRAGTGKVVWKTRIGLQNSGFIWDSPIVYRGMVIIGLASVSDCPLVPSGVFELNASTGKIVHVYETALSGCVGDGIWGSPALDAARGTIYVDTGNPGTCPQSLLTYGESMIELSARDLSLLGHWEVPPAQQVDDADFGATPTIFQATLPTLGKTEMVGAVNKNGIYYAFRADHLGAGPVWEKRIGLFQGNPFNGGINLGSAAWNGKRLFAAEGQTTIAGNTCAGSIRAMNPNTGKFLWQTCVTHYCQGAVTVVPGVAFAGCGNQVLGVSTQDGQVLYHLAVPGAAFPAPLSVSNGTLYASDARGLPDTPGHIYALAPPSS